MIMSPINVLNHLFDYHYYTHMENDAFKAQFFFISFLQIQQKEA